MTPVLLPNHHPLLRPPVRLALWAAALVGLVVVVAGCTKAPELPVAAIPAPASASAAETPVADANTADLDVTTNVKTALLRDDALKGFDIGVVVTKGDARLTGVVDTQAQIDTALRLARAAEGVHSIHDELRTKP